MTTRESIRQQLMEPDAGSSVVHAYPVPDALKSVLAPAELCLDEHWQFPLILPGVEQMRVGTVIVPPARPGLFLVRFANELGLSCIQGIKDGRPLGEPLVVEVISRKMGGPADHVAYFDRLVADLYRRAPNLPFTFDSRTARGIEPGDQPPTPLFLLHFLLASAPVLDEALACIEATPHRRLVDRPEVVPLDRVTDVDAEVLQRLASSPRDWEEIPGKGVLPDGSDWVPVRVWQRLPDETTDTPENRFVKAFLLELLAAGQRLSEETWWRNLLDERKTRVAAVLTRIRLALAHPVLACAGPMTRIPAASRVLMVRAGYRELLVLWLRYHGSSRPLFGALHHAIEVRNVAALYEAWAFFALVADIEALHGRRAELRLQATDDRGLRHKAVANFGPHGELHYNIASGERNGSSGLSSWSVRLRPDFTWFVKGTASVVFDAKFRLVRLPARNEEEDLAEDRAKHSDLHKMHAYRDALRVRACVAVYPGQPGRGQMFQPAGDARESLDAGQMLRELLIDGIEGVGAMPRLPAC